MNAPPEAPGPELRTYENLLQSFRDGSFARTTRHVPLGTPVARRHAVQARLRDRLGATGVVPRPQGTESFAWLVGRRPIIHLDVVHPSDRRLVLRIAGPGHVDQACVVRFNGHKLGELALPPDDVFLRESFDLPAELQLVGRNALELYFPVTHPRRLDGEGPTLAVAGRLRHVLLREEGYEADTGAFEAGLVGPEAGQGSTLLRLPPATLAAVPFALPHAERIALRYRVGRADVAYEIWFEDEQGRGQRLSSGGPGEADTVVEYDLTPWRGQALRLSIRTARAVEGFVEIGPAVVLAGGVDGPWDGKAEGPPVASGEQEAPAASEPAASRAVPGARPSFLMVVLDGLATDHVSAHGHERWTTPNLDALLAAGLHLEATAPASITAPTVASLLTGRSLSRTARLRVAGAAADDASESEATMATLAADLAAAGWETAALVGDAEASAVVTRDEGFALLESFTTEPADGTLGGRVVARAEKVLRGFGERPFLLYVHLPDPGAPYDDGFRGTLARPPYAGAATGSTKWVQAFRAGETLADWDGRRHLLSTYDGRLAALDALLGRLLLTLQWAGREADTVVVVTGAHGEAFGERNTIGHGETVHDEQLAVPLVLRGPGIAPGTGSSRATHADVAPTLLGLAGLVPSISTDGVGLLAGTLLDRGIASRGAAPVTDPARPPLAWTRGRWRLIIDLPTGSRELYDLWDDPDERDDLSSRRPFTAALLERELLADLSKGAAEAGAVSSLRYSLRRP